VRSRALEERTLIHKTPNQERGLVELTFAVAAGSFPGTIYVVGDFNGWDPEATPLEDHEDEWLQARVTVPSDGRFAFRYRTGDGRWFNDEGADDYEPNEFGGSNGVILT
jgi:1,4-alpha-glucan branching enzyme